MEAPQRTSIEVPCKADGDPTPNVTWTKDGVDLVKDQNHKLVQVTRCLFHVFIIPFAKYNITEKKHANELDLLYH